MKKPVHISDFLLERYRIGEVRPGERHQLEYALAQDPSLAEALKELDRADRDFREHYPPHLFFPGTNKVRHFPAFTRTSWLAYAAALIVIITLPLIILKFSFHTGADDRIKGLSGGKSAELSVYLQEQGKKIKLENGTAIQAGSTIQLVYQVMSSEEKYGVIFSIDGSSTVTMHYPYSTGQSTRLVSGKVVPLDEAYTLDNAPDYEIFFFVVGGKPLEVQDVMKTAAQLARRTGGKSPEAVQKGSAAYRNYEVQVITLLKNNQHK